MTKTVENSTHKRHEANDIIDFTRSVPPMPPLLAQCLEETLQGRGTRPDIGMLLRNALAGGSEHDRKMAARWLHPRFGVDLSPERIAVTNGTQSAVLLLLEGLVGQGGLLLTECLSYGVIKDLARRSHVRIAGLAMDEEGILPDAFEAACRRERPGALYCNPTDHNPTTAIASEGRRLALATIARKYGVPIIEDDPVGRLHPDAPPPVAALAPDVTWYVSGVTKCLAHGVRIAYLVAPSAVALERVVGPARRLSHWFPSPLMAMLVSDWIRSGAAEAITAAIRGESEARRQIALKTFSSKPCLSQEGETSAFHRPHKTVECFRILQGADFHCKPNGLHGWLRLPASMEANAFAQELAGAGVLVRPAQLFAVGDMPVPNAIRLSFSSPLERDAVENGVERIASLMAQKIG